MGEGRKRTTRMKKMGPSLSGESPFPYSILLPSQEPPGELESNA